MPHVIVELSRNVADRLDVEAVIRALHTDLCATDILPVGAIKTRAVIHDHFVVGRDLSGMQGFATALIRIQPGRPLESERKVAQVVFDAICKAVSDIADVKVSISVDVQHIFRDASLSRT